MDLLSDDIVQYILSLISNARDVANCSRVSKRWKSSMRYIRSLYVPHDLFANYTGELSQDIIILRLISSIVHLEELVVCCRFSPNGLALWLSSVGPSLRRLELRMDVTADALDHTSKLRCLNSAPNLESLKLWNVSMLNPLRWKKFQKLTNLQIVAVKIVNPALVDALGACPNLSNLLLYCREGLSSVVIKMAHLEQCKVEFCTHGNSLLRIYCPKIRLLEVHRCNWIQARETSSLKSLSISNKEGRVYMVDFDQKLVSLEYLSISGFQWGWGAISKILEHGSGVKHLYMEVGYTVDSGLPDHCPEIDFFEFFNNHPNLQKFDIHGGMFSALSQKNSLKNVDPDFVISSLEEISVTIQSPWNPEQKMNTLKSFLKYGKNLKKMVINILEIEFFYSVAPDFFNEICKLRRLNSKIVSIEYSHKEIGVLLHYIRDNHVHL